MNQGHSIDRTVDNAKKYPVKIIYEIIFENYCNVCGARQIGVVNANSEFIAFTDADCIHERKWPENLTKEFYEDIIGEDGGIKNIDY